MWIEFGAIVSALILLGAILTGYANIMSRIKRNRSQPGRI